MKTQIQKKAASVNSEKTSANQQPAKSVLQAYKNTTAQLAGEEEEPVQQKSDTAQLEEKEEEPVQQKSENKTGLPDNLKSGVENLSGYSMDDVKVHYNSAQPATLQAHAYAQGTDIHIAPGQEKHLPHEAWHVAQQKQGRVQPTMQMKGKVNINDDAGLENEADVMGAKAMQVKASGSGSLSNYQTSKNIVQMFDPLKTPRHALNANGQKAFDLLDNDRANFKAIDKSGGDVNAKQDSNKRVTSIKKAISNIRAERDGPLQTTIGWLGNLEQENVGAGYNGGHLIASSLGGSGTWQNMVPQDGPENKWGEWRQYEKENAAAVKITGEPLYVRVDLEYSGESVLPTTWKSWMIDKNDNDLNWYEGKF